MGSGRRVSIHESSDPEGVSGQASPLLHRPFSRAIRRSGAAQFAELVGRPRAAVSVESIGPSAIHVVLVYPEIHWNTGNAGRTCVATGAMLHLIAPLGFSLDDREVKRAGLDYWGHLDLRV